MNFTSEDDPVDDDERTLILIPSPVLTHTTPDDQASTCAYKRENVTAYIAYKLLFLLYF